MSLALALVIPIAGWLVNQFNGKYVFIGPQFYSELHLY